MITTNYSFDGRYAGRTVGSSGHYLRCYQGGSSRSPSGPIPKNDVLSSNANCFVLGTSIEAEEVADEEILPNYKGQVCQIYQIAST